MLTPKPEPIRPRRPHAPSSEPALRPLSLPPPAARRPVPQRDTTKFTLVLVALGVGLGIGVQGLLERPVVDGTPVEPAAVGVHTVERGPFSQTLRIGGTVGATDVAMIRAPRMRGRGDRGGSASLTIEDLAEPGSMVQQGDTVAVFEARRTEEVLDRYTSDLTQSRARAASRKASMLTTTETLRQRHRTARADAEKALLELRTAEVKSAIQAEILKLLAEQTEVAFQQLDAEVRLQELADASERRSLDIGVEKDRKRLDRTRTDFDRMAVRSPVAGLVVIETIYQRGSFAQAAPGDQVNGGAYLLRVVDLSKMAVFGTLNQVDAQAVAIGAPVRVRLDAFPEALFQGRVASVGAVATAGTSSGGGRRGGAPGSRGSRGEWVKQLPVVVDILAADERIVPDLSASAEILLQREDAVLTVPRSAVGASAAGSVVWVQDGEGFVERPVEVGALSDTQAVIRTGLRAGERVALQPVPSDGASGRASL